MALRIIFMGTPEFSVAVLESLHVAGHEIVACYTQPPRPGGRRGLDLVASPVQKAAEELGINTYCPNSLKSDAALDTFQKHKADVAVVVAYGMLLPQTILDTPKFGCFNGHASLLPRWRGAAPIQRAIMAGDTETGMMVMKMEAGLDTGPIAMMATVPIGEDTTAGSLHDELSDVGAQLMVKAMAALEANEVKLVPQVETGVTYAHKISKDETRVNWSEPASYVHRHIMGLSPFPGAWTQMELGGKTQRVKILSSERTGGSGEPGTMLHDGLTIACKSGAVRLLRLQRAGAKTMDADEFLRGYRPIAGAVLE